MRDAASARWTFLSITSLSGPESCSALARVSVANAASLSLNDIVCLKRRRFKYMALLHLGVEGGAQPGVLITDKKGWVR
jgi:hypothetical protein